MASMVPGKAENIKDQKRCEKARKCSWEAKPWQFWNWTSRAALGLEDDRVAGVHDLEGSLAGDVGADEHTDRTEHRKTPVVQLLGLVALPALIRLPLGRAEEIPGLVVWPPSVKDAEHLEEHDEGEDLKPAELWRLRQREQRVRRVLAVEERVPFVGHDHAKGGEHRHAAVLQLCLPVLLHRLWRGVLGEAERVEEAERRALARHI